jgi:hypothetical protein
MKPVKIEASPPREETPTDEIDEFDPNCKHLNSLSTTYMD